VDPLSPAVGRPSRTSPLWRGLKERRGKPTRCRVAPRRTPPWKFLTRRLHHGRPPYSPPRVPRCPRSPECRGRHRLARRPPGQSWPTKARACDRVAMPEPKQMVEQAQVKSRGAGLEKGQEPLAAASNVRVGAEFPASSLVSCLASPSGNKREQLASENR
jgi:hypothetical protein